MPARTALAIARALDDPVLVAGALAAIATAVVDPFRRNERRAWVDELLALADAHPAEPWRRWALPLDARARVEVGEVADAIDVFADLEASSDAVNDVVGRHAASYGRLLATTVVGDWDGARAAAARSRRTASAALLDEGAGIMAEMGMIGMLRFLSGVGEPVVAPGARNIEWPTPEMAATTNAYFGALLAQGGQLEEAQRFLDRTRTLLPDLGRDGYWLATLAMVADTCFRTGDGRQPSSSSDLLIPALELTITDPGLLYRGAAAHFAGLAASVLGRRDEAVELLARRPGDPRGARLDVDGRSVARRAALTATA